MESTKIQSEISKAFKAINSLPFEHALAPESWKEELRQQAKEMSCGGMFNHSPRKAGQSFNAMYAESRGELTLSKLPAVLKRMVRAGFGNSTMWHHTGQFKGHMNETTFYAACDFDLTGYENYLLHKDTIDAERIMEKSRLQEEETQRKLAKENWLKEHCEFVERTTERLFIELLSEMKGKYGWFDAAGKSYNLPEYYTGWKLKETGIGKEQEYYALLK